MRAVLRSIAAVFAGFVAASILMMIVEMINGRFLHPDLAKSAEGVTDRENLRALLAAAPASAFFVVLAGWILGGVAGGWITAWIAESSPAGHGLALGILLTIAGVANNLMIPPPLWFWIAGVVAFIPATCLGVRLARKL